MRIFIKDLNATEDVNVLRVGCIHYMPFDAKHGLGKTEDVLASEGVLLDIAEMPKPETEEGYHAMLCYNKNTRELFYTYETLKDDPSTYNYVEEITALQQTNLTLATKVAELTKEKENTNATVLTLMTEVAMLKGGAS
jgi:hypothetical protein